MREWRYRADGSPPSQNVVARIRDHERVLRHFGQWPDFEDAEVISLRFDRGNHLVVARTNDWPSRVPERLEALFYVFNAAAAPESPARRPANLLLAFSELHDACIEQLGYQNPIQGFAIRPESPGSANPGSFRVAWGGISHEVSLVCGSISVLSIEPLS